MQDQIIKQHKEEKMKIFCSYHFTTKDGKMNGFGNWMGEFPKEAYENAPEKFILEAQKTIEGLLAEKIGTEVAVKILFFR